MPQRAPIPIPPLAFAAPRAHLSQPDTLAAPRRQPPPTRMPPPVSHGLAAQPARTPPTVQRTPSRPRAGVPGRGTLEWPGRRHSGQCAWWRASPAPGTAARYQARARHRKSPDPTAVRCLTCRSHASESAWGRRILSRGVTTQRRRDAVARAGTGQDGRGVQRRFFRRARPCGL